MTDRNRDRRALADPDNPRPGLVSRDMVRRLNNIGLVGANQEYTRVSNSKSPGAVLIDGASGVYLSNNLYYDGNQWQRYNTAASGYLVKIGSFGPEFYYAAAGANPVAGWAGDGVLGEVVQAHRVSNLAIAAAIITNVHSMNLEPGRWLVYGKQVVVPGSTGSFDIRLSWAGGGAATPWAGSSVTVGHAMTVWTPVAVITNTATETVLLQTYGNVAFTASWTTAGAGGGDGTGIFAVRIG